MFLLCIIYNRRAEMERQNHAPSRNTFEYALPHLFRLFFLYSTVARGSCKEPRICSLAFNLYVMMRCSCPSNSARDQITFVPCFRGVTEIGFNVPSSRLFCTLAMAGTWSMITISRSGLLVRFRTSKEILISDKPPSSALFAVTARFVTTIGERTAHENTAKKARMARM